MVAPSLLSSDHQTDKCVTDKANWTLNRDEYLMGAGITVCIIPYRLMSRQQLTGRAARHICLVSRFSTSVLFSKCSRHQIIIFEIEYIMSVTCCSLADD